MKQISAGLALAFACLAAACGGSDKRQTTPSASSGTTCADVAANTEKQLLAVGGEQGANTELRQLATMARETVAERCPADGWTPEAIDCLAKASGETMEQCSKLLTDEQNQALEDSMKRRMNGPGGADGGTGGGEEKSRQMAPPTGAAPPDDPCGGDE